MRRGMLRRIVVVAVALTAAGPTLAQVPAKAPARRSAARMNFDGVAPGRLPAGWKVEATSGRGPLAVWKVVADPEAPSPPNVLRAVPRPDTYGGTYNLCWTSAVRFLDGEIEVKVRANTGHEDQGGGPMWRVRDANNYYVARYNPLEHNFRVYTVKNGARKMLDSASRIKVATGEWFTIRIVQHGDHIECFLDGEKLLDVHDTTFTQPGGVGLWTKSDAATSFDNLTIRPAER
ncbi:MAG TPA: DUF1080 domain-containing protein [Acidobacteria bacterium]|nr:DUF1080 domain-containing protein [Acidobacteriota bacterium]